MAVPPLESRTCPSQEAAYERRCAVHATERPDHSTFDEVWSSIEQGHAVVVGLSLSDAFYAASGGVVDAREEIDSVRRHAVIAMANGRASNTRCVKVRNSWGPKWGVLGHAWLAEEYLSPRLLAVMKLIE